MNISNFKIFNLIIVVGFLLPFIGLSQVKFGDYKPLYKDNNITIEVAFKNYGCGSNKSSQIIADIKTILSSKIGFRCESIIASKQKNAESSHNATAEIFLDNPALINRWDR